MRWIAVIFVLGLFASITGFAYLASAEGWGLPGKLDRPVSIREGSAQGGHRPGHTFLYFGGYRTHSGGGFRGGK